MSVPRIPTHSPVYFVRCELRDETKSLVADNVYWQAKQDDDLGGTKNDEQFKVTLAQWGDMSALSSMPKPELRVSSESQKNGAVISLVNKSNRIAFFIRAESLSSQMFVEIR